ncbi:NAD(P)(+) transhydrogenase (Re/Si-specific) subunit beta, partial [Brevundimonas sp.]|uniref:NAD(P)(+) transhydrogenase (Re/Si-specific) subunit beta n=1 Tax=Brevundimonas sp. TaxID=1871086 RepID=UPI003783223F
MNASLAALAYLVSGVLFILSLRGLSSPETSRQGNIFGMVGMGLAVAVTLLTLWGSGALDLMTAALIVGGVVVGGGGGALIAGKVKMTDMPQLVAAFHSLVGMAACLVAIGAVYAPAAFGISDGDGGIKMVSIIELSLGVAIGAITFTGSVIAFAKLNGNMSGAPIILPARHLINIGLALGLIFLIGLMIGSGGQATWAFWGVFAIALVLGATLIIPIGGADMPVVVSMLNSYSGWAAAALGFTLENIALIITGALVGSSGAILSYIMCKGMNRSFISVILGGFGGGDAAAGGEARVETRPVKQGSAEDAAFIMKNASKVIIVPGYGMAVAQAQHALREMADKLKEEGVEVKYAIHPVAGRMPGHMNVLLAEANVPYDEVFELEDINAEFASCDVAFVICA